MKNRMQIDPTKDCVNIEIVSKKHGVFITTVSTQDWGNVKEYSWSIKVKKNRPGTSAYYVVTNIKGKIMSLHRMIMKAQKGQVIDHINRNPLDNRRENLRVVTHSTNGYNKYKPKTNTTGYKNIYWDSARSLWKAKIEHRGKSYNSKRVATLEEAKIELCKLKHRLRQSEGVIIE